MLRFSGSRAAKPAVTIPDGLFQAASQIISFHYMEAKNVFFSDDGCANNYPRDPCAQIDCRAAERPAFDRPGRRFAAGAADGASTAADPDEGRQAGAGRPNAAVHTGTPGVRARPRFQSSIQSA